MGRGDVLSGAAFRAVLRSALVFVAALTLGAYITIAYIERTMMEEARYRVLELHHGILQLSEADNPEDLIPRVDTLIKATAGETLAYSVYSVDGTFLTGNVRIRLSPGSWDVQTIDIEGPRIGIEEYLLHASSIGDKIFVSGVSLKSIEAVEVAMVRGFALAGFFVVLTSIAIGYQLSRRSQRKLEHIEHVLEQVALGDGAARIGVDSHRDQIDRISEKIDKQLIKLDSLMQGTRRASAAVAHDLRKPLARTVLRLEKGLAKAENGEDVRLEMEDALAGLGKLNTIISTILRIARIESHDIGDFTTFDLREVLDEVADTYEAVAEDGGQKLIYERPASALDVFGDADMIAQLVINLVQNSITHSGRGATVRLDAQRRPQGVALSVADDGPGIPEELRERVFEPLYRADAARTTDGNGLGLALVKAIAERHGTRLELTDANPGLRVTVMLGNA